MYTELNEKIGTFHTVDLLGIDNGIFIILHALVTFRTVDLLGINNFELVCTGTLITFRTMNLLGIDNLVLVVKLNHRLSVL